jgi:hypothetical protein
MNDKRQSFLVQHLTNMRAFQDNQDYATLRPRIQLRQLNAGSAVRSEIANPHWPYINA